MEVVKSVQIINAFCFWLTLTSVNQASIFCSCFALLLEKLDHFLVLSERCNDMNRIDFIFIILEKKKTKSYKMLKISGTKCFECRKKKRRLCSWLLSEPISSSTRARLQQLSARIISRLISVDDQSSLKISRNLS